MNSDVQQFQWVDEDPFERFQANARKRAVKNELCSGDLNLAGNSVNDHSAQADPKDLAAEFELADSFEKQGQWDAAANSFRKILEIEPGHVRALIGLGACLLHLDKLDTALKCFEDCLGLDAGHERALLGKAVALHKLNRYEEADLTYRKLLEITPEAPEPLANLIALSVARQDAVAVEEHSRRLLRVDPNSKAALQGLATHAIWTGDHAAAIEYCSRLLEYCSRILDADPVSFEGWSNLGHAKRSMRHGKQVLRSIA